MERHALLRHFPRSTRDAGRCSGETSITKYTSEARTVDEVARVVDLTKKHAAVIVDTDLNGSWRTPDAPHVNDTPGSQASRVTPPGRRRA